jgi:hypothetical protein
VSATTTVFHESGGELEATVITPSVNAAVDLGEWVTVRAGWEADIVTGASVAVVDAPAAGVDVISSATVFDDFRNTAGGGIEVRSEHASVSAGYTYGFESDYRSHAFTLVGRAELLERNTILEIRYARGFDSVCNLLQPRAQEAVDRARMPTSDGCFEEGLQRESLDLDIQSFQGGWTQAWTPVLTTQLTLTTQLLHGYQGNPYRAVWLGRSGAQEFHPTDRARYALGLGVRWWLKPVDGAVQLFGRAYRDTWDVTSVTAELAYEQLIGGDLRLRVRGRYYLQSGAMFYSDDYSRFPRGQYFTGDRELSPMSSITVGGQIQYSIPPGDDGAVLGFLETLDLVGKADYIMFDFSDYHYGRADIPTQSAIVGTISIEAAL